MKIVSQLQSQASSAVAKNVTSADSVTDFRDVLTTAKADTTPISGPDRKSDKSSAIEDKKKIALPKDAATDPNIDLRCVVTSPTPQPIIVVPSIAGPSGSPKKTSEENSQNVASVAAMLPRETTDASAKPQATAPTGTATLGSKVVMLSAGPAKPSEVFGEDPAHPGDVGARGLQAEPSAKAQPESASSVALAPSVSVPATNNTDAAGTPGTTTPGITSAADSATPTQPAAIPANQGGALPAPLPSFLSSNDKESAPQLVTRKSIGPSTDSPINGAASSVASSSAGAPAPSLPGLREAIASGVPAPIAVPTATANVTVSNDTGITAKDASPRQTPLAAKSKSKAAPSEEGDDTTGDKTGTVERKGATEDSPSFIRTVEGSSPTHDTSVIRAAIDAGSVQQTVSVGLADKPAHGPQTAQTGSGLPNGTIASPSLQAAPDPQAMQGLTSAQLTQSMRSTEMKLGMQSAEFGSISITTSLNHQAISAQISLDHTELGRALAVHLPAIEEKLGSAYGVQARVELRESYSPAQTSDSGYSSSGRQNRERRQSEEGGSTAPLGAAFERFAGRTAFSAPSLTANHSRLDIRI